jgi:hypothetical protein
MKILRSVMRRGFSVGSAGYFTVLKPNTWFAASRLSDSFRYPSDRYKGLAAGQNTLDHADSQTANMPSLLVRWRPQEPRLVRMALIALAAMMITAALLWWIMASAPPNVHH